MFIEDREKVADSTLSVQILDGTDLYFLAHSTVSRVLRQVNVSKVKSESSTSESLVSLEVSALEILND